MVCLHGFTDTWRTWDLVRPALEGGHELLAVTLAGHAGGPPIEGEVDDEVLADAVEHAMDEAGFQTAHIVGNSLGGFVALQLAERGRARTVLALAPAGGWGVQDESYKQTLEHFKMTRELLENALAHTETILSTVEGRRLATQFTTINFEHIPVDLLAHQMHGVVGCEALLALIEYGMRQEWRLNAERITCPVRIVWGTEDKLLPWPGAAARMRSEWLPNADWVELEDIGHCPQLDCPLETAQLILDFVAR